MLKRSDYVVYTDTGAISAIYCKLCGGRIAHVEEGILKYLKLFGQLKMRFSDGSAHTTPLCTGCIPLAAQSPEILQELHQADLAELASQMPVDIGKKFLEINQHREKPKFHSSIDKPAGLL